MTALSELLERSGIKSAVVIDDAYDKVPKASDLDGQDIWATFFADATPSEAVLAEIFPAYPEMEPEQLRLSDQFVAALWEAEGKLPPNCGIRCSKAIGRRSQPTGNFLTTWRRG